MEGGCVRCSDVAVRRCGDVVALCWCTRREEEEEEEEGDQLER